MSVYGDKCKLPVTIDELEVENRILEKQNRELRSDNFYLQNSLSKIQKKIETLNLLNNFINKDNLKDKEILSNLYNEISNICNKKL